jgi:hypothetical protein
MKRKTSPRNRRRFRSVSRTRPIAGNASLQLQPHSPGGKVSAGLISLGSSASAISRRISPKRSSTGGSRAIEDVRFASDSPLEGGGFEPSVPRHYLASDRRIAFNQQGIFRHYLLSTAERPGVMANRPPQSPQTRETEIGRSMPNRAKTGHPGVEHAPLLVELVFLHVQAFQLAVWCFPTYLTAILASAAP